MRKGGQFANGGNTGRESFIPTDGIAIENFKTRYGKMTPHGFGGVVSVGLFQTGWVMSREELTLFLALGLFIWIKGVTEFQGKPCQN